MTAANGAEAYELACEEKPDIIVTDYQMPVMSGLQLVEKIRANDETRAIPVILLTARSFAIEDDQKRDLQIAECLSKPFSPKELLRSIEDVLYRRAVVQS
jgi:two-component system phosphate regulon response regulator PhoB